MDISFEQLQYLILEITKKDIFYYINLITNFIGSILILAISIYFFIKKPNQMAKIRIYEKEIELLYEAFNHFCKFSDKVGLFTSNKYRKFLYLSKPNELSLDSNFEVNEIKSTEEVYDSFSDENKASGILISIGANNLANTVKEYRKTTVDLRMLIISFEEKTKNKDKSDYDNICIVISKKRDDLNKIKESFFIEMKKFKANIKNKI